MATYVISDIHGNLDVFKELLKTIDLKYDGTDQLYLLGDYVDWGSKSLETLFFVMELTQKYPFITALLGNHDLMFLEQIEGYKKDKWYKDSNWLYSNGGDKTWAEYLQLEEDERVKVQEYLENLPFVTDIIVGDKKYLAAHACPVHKFEYDEIIKQVSQEQFDMDEAAKNSTLREQLDYDEINNILIRARKIIYGK
jgi:serine/threonine protein phosphatase 1